MGDLISRDLVEPNALAAEHQSVFPARALSALTVNGRLYGIPPSVDTVALIHNTQLAPQPPKTLDELIATGRRLASAWPLRNPSPRSNGWGNSASPAQDCSVGRSTAMKPSSSLPRPVAPA
ncbi:hypothetical protein ACGFY9_43565 [Streptomyces sp. NPDC048504]|uniref:hypothetical protein n=1 Tax=Streptomyces sp. NPDC048504 TaxID=3365559 RepID=UPI003720A5E5